MIEKMKPAELVLMASLGCSPNDAVAELRRLEPALINLAHLYPVATGLVTASTLLVRERPAATAQVIGRLHRDDTVRIWGRSADAKWLAVDEPCGWVSADWVAEL